MHMHMLILWYLCPKRHTGCPKSQQPLGEHETLEPPLHLLSHFARNKAKFLFKSTAHKAAQKQAQISSWFFFFFHKCIINCKKSFLLLVLYSPMSNLNPRKDFFRYNSINLILMPCINVCLINQSVLVTWRVAPCSEGNWSHNKTQC